MGWRLAPLPCFDRLFGKVTNIADHGAFVEIEPGIEGLVRLRNGLDQQNVVPNKIVNLGDGEWKVMVRKSARQSVISLGMKQCRSRTP